MASAIFCKYNGKNYWFGEYQEVVYYGENYGLGSGAPSNIKEGIEKAEAEEIKAKLTEVGAEVVLK